MNSERPTAETQSASAAASESVVSRSGCYLAASPMGDVLFDQLDYLLAHVAERTHGSQPCAPDCMDCGRLQQVKNWLLMPFHTAIHPQVQ
ncbi:MAG TPA: hypothetical protein VLY24_08380 [Bryobacteraceae bacterium]|nr:hypothetical protein [Bryobacteraceae bacterium]